MNFIRNSSWKTVCGWHLYNPLRYRGYVYDTDTGLYYLQSRYYDPEMGRFLNADGFVSTGQGFSGNNMFAYGLNNPTAMADDALGVWKATKGVIQATYGLVEIVVAWVK